MDKLEKVKKYLEHCMNNNGCDACEECAYGGESYLICKNLVKDTLELLKEQNGLMLALDQSNSANEYLNEEVDKLNTLLRQQQDEIAELTKQQNRSKHGHWKVLQNCFNSGVYCSECNTKMFDHYPMKKKLSEYCGHCGSHNDLNVEVV